MGQKFPKREDKFNFVDYVGLRTVDQARRQHGDFGFEELYGSRPASERYYRSTALPYIPLFFASVFLGLVYLRAEEAASADLDRYVDMLEKEEGFA